MAESDVLRRRIPDDEVYRPIFEAEVITVSLYVKVHISVYQCGFLLSWRIWTLSFPSSGFENFLVSTNIILRVAVWKHSHLNRFVGAMPFGVCNGVSNKTGLDHMGSVPFTG